MPPKPTMLPTRLVTLLEAHSRAIALVVAAVLLGGGLLYSVRLGDELKTWDEIHYTWLGENLVKTGMYTLDGSSPSAFRPPGYPLLLAGVHALGGGVVQYRMLNFLLLSATFLLLHDLVSRVFSRAAAALTLLLLLAYPILFYQSGALYPQTFASFLLVGMLHALMLHADQRGAFVVAGVLYGLLLLAVPAYIFLLPVLPLWYLVQDERRAAMRFVVVSAGLALVLTGAWSLRNQRVLGSFVYISCNSGKNLLFGNSEHSTYKSGTTTNIDAYVAEVERRGYVTHSVEAERYYGEQAREYILRHPIRCAGLYLGKFLYHFSYYNDPASEGVRISALQRVVLFLSFVPWLILFVVRVGAIPWRPLCRAEMLFAGIYLASALFHAIYITRIRFRLPVDPFLFAVAAHFLSTSCRRGPVDAKEPAAAGPC